jgi:hypothetical protein
VTEKPITAENYSQRAIVWIRTHGGLGFVIRSPYKCECKSTGRITPEQWDAWIKYWDRIGFPTKFVKIWGVATVPTEWPGEFS